MDFELPQNHKFACLAFSGATVDGDVADEVELGNGLWAFSRNPLPSDEPWRDWMGRIVADQLDRANFVLLAEQVSESPEVLDDETKRLERQVGNLLHGVLLGGIPGYASLLVFAGARVGPRFQIRQMGRGRNFYFQAGARPMPVRAEGVAQAARMCWNIEKLAGEDYVSSRLLRGSDAWKRGVQERYEGYRLHEFVRSLEAILNVAGRKKFARRLKLFVEGPPPTDDEHDDELDPDLVETYKIRNEIEHVKRLGMALQDLCSGRDWESVYTERCAQAEAISRFVYRRIFSDSGLQPIFATDESVEHFWSRPVEERQEIWGPRLDMTAAVNELLSAS